MYSNILIVFLIIGEVAIGKASKKGVPKTPGRLVATCGYKTPQPEILTQGRSLIHGGGAATLSSANVSFPRDGTCGHGKLIE